MSGFDVIESCGCFVLLFVIVAVVVVVYMVKSTNPNQRNDTMQLYRVRFNTRLSPVNYRSTRGIIN